MTFAYRTKERRRRKLNKENFTDLADYVSPPFAKGSGEISDDERENGEEHFDMAKNTCRKCGVHRNKREEEPTLNERGSRVSGRSGPIEATIWPCKPHWTDSASTRGRIMSGHEK